MGVSLLTKKLFILNYEDFTGDNDELLFIISNDIYIFNLELKLVLERAVSGVVLAIF